MSLGGYDPSFPDVPFADGVPACLRSEQPGMGSVINDPLNVSLGAAQQPTDGVISNVQDSATGPVNGAFGAPAELMTADSPEVSGLVSSNQGQWGIFDQSGNQVLEPDSFKSLAYKHGWKIANYPMEQGAFQSYNKVQTPFEVTVVMTKGGTDSDRSTFLNAVDTVAASFDLYNVVTPEYPYPNVSLEHFSYQRTSTNGNKLLTVDLDLLEVRVIAPSTFSDTAAPSGADAVNTGTVQTQTPTASQQAAVAGVQ